MAEGVQHLTIEANIILYSILIIVIPFATGLFLMLLRGFEIKRGKNYSETLSSTIGIGGLATSWILSIIVAFKYFTEDYVTLGEEHADVDKLQYDYSFLPNENGPLKWGILLDPLSVIFLVVLTTIALLIHLYSADYMHADPSYTRFFGTMNFFTASMLAFILAPNLFMGFVFWEFLGFSSYLLIGFYWHKPSASSAMKKAFLYNKVGDVSFMIGIALIYRKMVPLAPEASLDYLEIAHQIDIGELKFGDVVIPALLIFGGAVGKSAQFPLFGWLPEAMEGPTPVSSLLHSSTMVKAGLFLVARNFFLFYQNEGSHVLTHTTNVVTQSNLDAASIVAWTGTITALIGALIALTQGDIKKVLAFSTVSQLGYIMMALGSGGIAAGFYHMISHATFKSLLFLCAGAVIHSVHSQDMKDMGGLRNYMPATTITMGIGLLGLSGVIFTNGFWSKDAVLLSIKTNEAIFLNEVAWGIAVFTAGITAFYSAKLFILVFLGEGRYDRDHVHPAPTATKMKIPLIALAFFVVLESVWWTLGTLVPSLRDNSESYWNFEFALGSLFNAHGGEFAFTDAIPSTVMGLLGIVLAFGVYYWKWTAAVKLKTSSFMASLEKIAVNRFGMDLLIYWIVENPIMWIGDRFQYMDKEVIDGIFVDQFAAEGSLWVAEKSDDFDNGIIDGTVDWVGNRTRDVGYYIRTQQTGKAPNYARFIGLGLAAILLIFTFNNLF